MTIIKFPTNIDKNPQRRSVGTWIAQKRRLYKKGTLSKYWIDKFEQTFPEWSWDPTTDRVVEKKAKLLEMARTGEPKPKWQTSLGIALTCYTKTSNTERHVGFKNQLIAIGCKWFNSPVMGKKQQLLELARNREAKPHHKTSLGRALVRYVTKSPQYDPVFKEQLVKTGCDWFKKTAPSPHTTEKKKKLLLEMAKKGERRPTQKTPLGRALREYVTKRSIYYPAFREQLVQTGCDWFKNSTKIKKQQLLDLAEKGEAIPQGGTSLRRTLKNYTNKSSSSYDPEFDEQIRNIVPQWLISPGDKHKMILLELLRLGKSRPNSKKTRLGRALISYTNKSCGRAYDPEFDKEIRKLAPHWFRKRGEY